MIDQKFTGGLTKDEINEKVDVLILGMDQLENKLRRRIADETGSYRDQYKAPLLRSVQRLLRLEQSTSLFTSHPEVLRPGQKANIDTGAASPSKISETSGSPDLFGKPRFMVN
jgi:hypothetical protein